MDTDRIRLLVVEDEPVILTEIDMVLEEVGYRVDKASSVEEALASLAITRFDAVVLDLQLKHVIAVEVAEFLVRSGTPYVVCSGYIPDDSAVWSDAAARLPKPCDGETILRTMASVVAPKSNSPP